MVTPVSTSILLPKGVNVPEIVYEDPADTRVVDQDVESIDEDTPVPSPRLLEPTPPPPQIGKGIRKATSRRQAYDENLEYPDAVSHAACDTGFCQLGIHRDQLLLAARNWKKILTRIKAD